MNQEVVVVLGNLAAGRAAIDPLAQGFGWSVEPAQDLKQLRTLATEQRVVAVLLDARALGMSWEHALDAVRCIVPRALTIVCHRFSEAIEWPELADAGAFHALPVPFDSAEVRQSLGYVAAAMQNRRAGQLSMRQVA